MPCVRLLQRKDLDRALNETEAEASEIEAKMKPIADRMRVISKIHKSYETYVKYKEINDTYHKKFWKGRKAKYAEEHKKELDAYNRAYHFLKKCGLEEPFDVKPLLNEYAALKVKHADLSEELDYIERDLGWLKDIRGQVDEIVDRQEREQRERERERDRKQNKVQKPTSVLEQKMMEAKQKLREQRMSKKKQRGEMER